MSQKAIYLLISLVVLCIPAYFLFSATYGSKESVTAVYHGQKIKINDKERLIHLIREYAKFGNDRFLNQAINDNIINEFGKSGLK